MLLMTTIDDLPPESLPYIIDLTIEKGANNIHVMNAITKKGRMEHIVLVDTDEKYMDDICSLLALEFGTLGIKIFKYEHVKFPYNVESKTISIKAYEINLETEIRIKYIENGGQIISLKAEYEDLRSLVMSINKKGIEIPLEKLKTIIEAEAYQNILNDKKISIKVI